MILILCVHKCIRTYRHIDISNNIYCICMYIFVYIGMLMCICVCMCVCMDTYAIESGCHL